MIKDKEDKISILKCPDCKKLHTKIWESEQKDINVLNKYCRMCEVYRSKNINKKKEKTDE